MVIINNPKEPTAFIPEDGKDYFRDNEFKPRSYIMNTIKITPEKVQLTLLLNELNIFKSSLTEVLDTLPQYGFETRINLSRKEVFNLRNKLSRLLENNKIKTHIEFTRKEILGLNSSLNEICHGISISNFKTKIGANKETVKELLHSFSKTIEKMVSEDIQVRIGNRQHELSKIINPFSIQLPRLSQTRRECKLVIDKYRIFFLLFSLKNSKTYSGIKAVIFNINNNKHILFKTVIQQISVNTLFEIISYFDEYIYLTKKEDVFDKYVLSALNYNNHHILDIQALSGNIISEKEGTLNIHLSLNISDEENINKYFDVQAPVSFDVICKFTTAIKEYLIDTVDNDAK